MRDDREVEWSNTLDNWPPCTRNVWDGRGDGPCESTVAVFLKYLGNSGIGVYCGNDHMRPEQFPPHEDLRSDGKFAAAEVPERFLTSKSGRRSSEHLRDSVRFTAHQHSECLWCGVPPAPLLARARFTWLRRFDRALFELVALALGETYLGRPDSEDNWLAALPKNIERDVQLRLDDSHLDADHVFPVVWLREAKDRLPAKTYTFALKDLGAPSCKMCNRGRTRLILEHEAVFEAKVVRYFFKTAALAKASPKFTLYQEVLAQCINAANRIERRASSGK
jgi:hypothetical protein